MLADPINLLNTTNIQTTTAGSPDLAEYRVVDPGATIGRTVRKGSSLSFDETTLTITHTESRESKPYGTKRVSLRLDAVKGAGTPAEPVAQPFVQLIFGQPKALVTTDEMYELAAQLLNFVLTGPGTGETTTSADGRPQLAFILNGEG